MQPYVHFTLEERIRLQEYLTEGKSLTLIAHCLNRSRSSVYRELKRNANKDKTYHHWRATSLYIQRRRKCGRTYVLNKDESLRAYVIEKLKLYWPPECIAARLQKDHPQMRISFTTIYRAVQKGLLPSYIAKNPSQAAW